MIVQIQLQMKQKILSMIKKYLKKYRILLRQNTKTEYYNDRILVMIRD